MARAIAHRAGNDLSLLRKAEELGIELVEADVRLWRRRLEVRHRKTLGPIPILWDRCEVANPLAPRLSLGELLDAASSRTELLLDLKGSNPRLSNLVLAELERDRRVTVCARSWRLLEPFADRENVTVVYSVGTRRELARLRRRVGDRRLDGVSIHERLVDASNATQLRQLSAVLMSWPVNTVQRARELAALGVDGMITDNLELAAALR